MLSRVGGNTGAEIGKEFILIVAREFFDILGQNARLNRMTSAMINLIDKRHRKIEDRVEEKGVRYGHSAILEYIQERVIMEASVRMHDEGLRHIRFSREECPKTYDLIVSGKITLDLEGK